MHACGGVVSTVLSFIVLAAASRVGSIQNVTECSCGYYDPATREVYTDSAIVYFNETTSLPGDVFAAESYGNKYEKGWNTRYTQGAEPTNVDVGEDLSAASSNTSLRLYVRPSDHHHVVVGGSVHTVRRDIFYGSFRALMRSPRSWCPGSALSMTLHYNESQTINFDLMNPDDPAKAWVGMFVRNEFPDRDLGVNYTALSNSTNGVLPWDYTELRIDWFEKKVDYYIGGKLFRTVVKDKKKNYPQTPAPLRLKHWSVGNWFTMQGPPTSRSEANVGWVRFFFNSSLITDQDREELLLRCSLEQACSTENMALRGFTPFNPESVVDWTQAQLSRPDRTIPKVIIIICGSLSGFLTVNALLRRMPHLQRRSRLQKEIKQMNQRRFHPSAYRRLVQLTSDHSMAPPSPPFSRPVGCFGPTNFTTPVTSQTPVGSSEISLGDYLYSQQSTGRPKTPFDTTSASKRPRLSWRQFSDNIQGVQPILGTLRTKTGTGHDRETTESRLEDVRFTTIVNNTDEDGDIKPRTRSLPALSSQEAERTASIEDELCSSHGIRTTISRESPTKPAASHSTVRTGNDLPDTNVFCLCSNLDKCEDDRRMRATSNALHRRPRIDYLAGLLTLSCLIVTAIQFSLTFSPASVDPGADPHYKMETWARKTIGPYFLNLVWVGPFLLTSTRFLVCGYLESDGDLQAIAEITVRRPFRLLVPVFAIAMLEYFFMDSGAIKWLEYMASVTWSTWQFTKVPNNFGYFLSEILELAYLIPNAVPQITFSYCTGVLWSIPVQLQGSWVALLGVIVIREIKTPWKRCCYYAFCIVMHWYALSWGTYFYFGIMLADLDINSRYKKLLYARPVFYYPLILICTIATLGGLTTDMVTQWTDVNYAAYEYGIHPDMPTAEPIMLTGAVGYPQYYVPKLNGIIFAFGLQTLVDLSPFVQKFFSLKIFTFAFKHIFAIYLIHGFVFWSLGSAIFIHLSRLDVAYWKMVTVVAVCCYSALFLGVPILTPIVAALGKSVPRNIWQFANETPSPRKPTLHPFPTNFLFVRQAFVLDEGHVAAAQKNESVGSAESRRPFKKFCARLVAALSPRFSCQPCQPGESLAHSGSRKVGWRTGGLSKNVMMLKRNNSGASRANATS